MSKYTAACRYISKMGREPSIVYGTGHSRESKSFDSANDAYVEAVKITEQVKASEDKRWASDFSPVVLKEITMVEAE